VLTPDSKGIVLALTRRAGLCAKTNDMRIIEAGMISANDP
jgi:hypothetical protein